MITVITQSTSERLEETRQLFQQIKPFLDEGLSFNKAFLRAGLFSSKYKDHISWCNYGWSREVVEYAKKQGYGV
ncbi:MAG: hypothetical protein IJI42_09325 [Methanobrevibacter sp.]|nr:hypothetical protein [Methanobrevibacter sp.]